jgi:hypothetical protein
VSGGAGCEEKGGAAVFAIGQLDLECVRPARIRRLGDLESFGNDREPADELAASAEVRLRSSRA